MTIRMTSLIKKLGKEYNSMFLPGLVSYMKENNSDAQDVQYKGIYLNIRLSDEQLLSMLDQSIKMGEQYGESDIHAGQTMIAEYSSPNAAKHLHAGHIRSTVIGQILANIYEKTGYGVHRLNHINDRGGFGELIE
ncbi:arginine--tRNA ligase [Patescibacteria group bacterium]|nr:arginine--tRNA ligase [Patescibacteria group bacterium]